MRLWSIHPKYLDAKGLVALWREGLLAKNVLEGKTKGYKNHPQLVRFKNAKNPVESINNYLSYVVKEALNRRYNFDESKLNVTDDKQEIVVTNKQIEYEFKHLLNKLENRDMSLYEKFKDVKHIELHPMFKEIEGEIEEWEVIV
ncbi:MAG: hypothetical protein KC589_02610 [Nanoarchaeota archaeon]|nr:hypothetical protein [Nanoarchaeota archaeon]